VCYAFCTILGPAHLALDLINIALQPIFGVLIEPVHTEDTETSIVDTIGTQTQEKKNRKKRAFLGLNEANASKKIKTTDDQKESYYKFILKQCVKPPKKGEKKLPLLQELSMFLLSYY
jgi:hypothetical protein